EVDYAFGLLKSQSAVNRVRRPVVEQCVGRELAATCIRSPGRNGLDEGPRYALTPCIRDDIEALQKGHRRGTGAVDAVHTLRRLDKPQSRSAGRQGETHVMPARDGVRHS